MHQPSFLSALISACRQWKVALLLAHAGIVETRRANRIALLMPFLSVLLQSLFLGGVYSQLLGVDLKSYLPYLAVSLALWQGFAQFLSIASAYNDTIHCHMTFMRLSPYTFHIAGVIDATWALVARLAAALLVTIVATRSFPPLIGIILAMLGIFALSVLYLFLGVVLAYLLDKYRILKAMLPQVLFLAFLITPVVWQRQQLANSTFVVDANPLYHGLEIVRTPLLTGAMPWTSFAVVLLLALALSAACVPAHRLNRELIVFRWIA